MTRTIASDLVRTATKTAGRTVVIQNHTATTIAAMLDYAWVNGGEDVRSFYANHDPGYAEILTRHRGLH